MKNHHTTNRREFIKKSAKVTALGIGTSLLGTGSLISCASSSSSTNTFKTGFEQTPLAYDFGALEPHIDRMTMEIHYSKHAAGYARKLRSAIEDENIMAQSVEEILPEISTHSSKVRNNAGGHYNHELFWKVMKPSAESTLVPEGKLADAINATFDSFDRFKTVFGNAAKTRFGSGWAWLVVDDHQKLAIGSTPNQDNPLMDISEFRGTPILGIDVWEHAYYLKYQNLRGDYINNWWNLVNWEEVAARLGAIG